MDETDKLRKLRSHWEKIQWVWKSWGEERGHNEKVEKI